MSFHDLGRNECNGPMGCGTDCHGGDEEGALMRKIGTALRSLRKQRGLSLKDLNRLSGVSRSMLSQIETGKSIPSVIVLCKIARAFKVAVADLLQVDEERPVMLTGEKTPLRISADGKCAWRLLMPARGEGMVEFYEITLRGGCIEKTAPFPPGTRANLAVSTGVLVVCLSGQRHRLADGDVLEFSASVEHTLINPGGQEAMAYLVLRRHP